MYTSSSVDANNNMSVIRDDWDWHLYPITINIMDIAGILKSMNFNGVIWSKLFK